MTFSARDLVAGYGRAPRNVLDGVSLKVPDGSLYAVLGPNGSGKSTLLRVLLGVLPPRSGSAEMGGRAVASWGRREMARAVGVVPQSESIAFPLPVRDLVAMGRYPHLGALRAEREADRRAVRVALEVCDVANLAGRDATTLSGGELQRVRIARALAQEPLALALDEPTSSLDIRHEMSILELLRASADGGLTVLLVTHHLNLAARFADRILLLHQGKVAAEGSPREVFVEDVLERVYGWPVKVDEDPVAGAPRVVPLGRPVAREGAGRPARARVSEPAARGPAPRRPRQE